MTTPGKYSPKGKSPVFEPVMQKPALSELYDLSKYRELVNQINVSDIPQDVKTFLKFAATRHIIYKFDAIGNYYANSEKDMQGLMEESKLVIVDYNDNIDKGFKELQARVAEEYQRQLEIYYPQDLDK